MGQQVGRKKGYLLRSHPKPSDLTVSRSTDASPEDLIRARRKALK